MFLSLMILLIPSLEDPCLASGFAMPFETLDAPEVYAQIYGRLFRPLDMRVPYHHPRSGMRRVKPSSTSPLRSSMGRLL